MPETRLAKISGHEVSMQIKVHGIEFNNDLEYDRMLERVMMNDPKKFAEHKADLERLAILDMVGFNMDRNISNFIYDESRNRIHAIDHADSFPIVEKAPGMIWFWQDFGAGLDRKIESATLEKIMSIDAEQLAIQVRKDGLIEEPAIELMKRRVNRMKELVSKNPKISMRALSETIDQEFVEYTYFERRH